MIHNDRKVSWKKDIFLLSKMKYYVKMNKLKEVIEMIIDPLSSGINNDDEDHLPPVVNLPN